MAQEDGLCTHCAPLKTREPVPQVFEQVVNLSCYFENIKKTINVLANLFLLNVVYVEKNNYKMLSKASYHSIGSF